MRDDDTNDLIMLLAAGVLILALLLSHRARAGEARTNPGDNASERTPELVQQGATCQKARPASYLDFALWLIDKIKQTRSKNGKATK